MGRELAPLTATKDGNASAKLRRSDKGILFSDALSLATPKGQEQCAERQDCCQNAADQETGCTSRSKRQQWKALMRKGIYSAHGGGSGNQPEISGHAQ